MELSKQRRYDAMAMGAIFLVTLLSSCVVYRPGELYFFGDTWDILCEFIEHGWGVIWRLHNTHFMPASKTVLFLQYGLFGMHSTPYQLVNLVIHSLNAVLVYVVAGELTSPVIPRVFGALFFSLSTVYWELTMWEAGQQTTLALFFILLSLALGHRYLATEDGRLLAVVMLSALFASWSMGFGLLTVPLLIVQALVWGRRRWKTIAALCVLPAAAILFGFIVLWLTDPAGISGARGETKIGQLLHVIPWTWTGLRALAASYVSPLSLAMLLSVLFGLAGLFYWRSFFSKQRLAALVVALALLLLPHVLTAMGRVQHGMSWAASSRYQYLPAAGLGLILAWVAGGIFEITRDRFLLTFVALLTLPAHAISNYAYVPVHSPMLDHGRRARRFVDLAFHQRSWENVPPGMACLHPDLYLPPDMYPFHFFSLSRVLPLYAADGVFSDACNMTLPAALNGRAISQFNLLAGIDTWRSYGSIQVTSDAAQAVHLEILGASAYGLEVPCANNTHVYSFVASVQSIAGYSGTQMRILFKNRAGDVIEIYPAMPITAREGATMEVSAIPSPGTAIVAVDFAGSAPASETSTIAVKDAALLELPAYVPVR